MHRFISDEEYLKLRADDIVMMDSVAVGKGVLDDLTQEINSILDNYRDDYSESNYFGYDMDNVLERDTLLEILEKIDKQAKFSEKEKIKAISFLNELKEDFTEQRVIKAIDTLILII